MVLNFQFNDPWQEYDLNHFKWRKVGPIPLALPITSIWQRRGGYDGGCPFSPTFFRVVREKTKISLL